MEKFQTSSEIHSINTRLQHGLHVTNAKLTKEDKGVYCAGSKSYSAVPSSIKILNHHIKVFKSALKDYVVAHSFCHAEEFFFFN
jgi:hypothetical protein